jgi:hypothetical protein
MINKITISLMGRLYPMMANSGIKLAPSGNTPLYQMVKASAPAEGIAGDDLAMLVLKGSAQVDAGGIEQHDLLMDETVDTVVPGILNQINFAKYEVSTAIGAVLTNIRNEISESKPTNISLVPVYLSEAVNSQFTVQLYENYQGRQLRKMRGFVGMPSLTEEELVELIKTGSATFDASLSNMLSSKPSGWVKDVYQRLVAGNVEGLSTTIKHDLCDEFLVALLMTIRLGEEIPESVNMQLPAYQAAISTNCEVLAVSLANSVDAYWTAVKNGLVMLDIPIIPAYCTDDSLEIKVYGPVAQKLYENGGSPETIFGAALGMNKAISAVVGTLDSLLAHRDDLNQIYLNWWAGALSQHKSNAARLVRDATVRALGAQVVATPENKRAPNFKLQDLVSLVRDKVKTLSDDQLLNDLDHQVLLILTSTVYSHTSAGTILTNIELYAKKYPDLDARSAAYLAYRDYVVDWVLSMVDVKR